MTRPQVIFGIMQFKKFACEEKKFSDSVDF